MIISTGTIIAILALIGTTIWVVKNFDEIKAWLKKIFLKIAAKLGFIIDINKLEDTLRKAIKQSNNEITFDELDTIQKLKDRGVTDIVGALDNDGKVIEAKPIDTDDPTIKELTNRKGDGILKIFNRGR